MKKIKNSLHIGWLMAFSQLLLTAFVVQWLFSQYNSEKDQLRKDLLLQFTESRKQVMDSMLVKNLINPILNDSSGLKIKLRIEDNDAEADTITEDFIGNIPSPHNLSDTDFRTIDTSRKNFDKMITVRHNADSSKELLVHGVKMIVKEMSSLPGQRDIEQTIYFNSDTILFKKLLADNLNKNGLRFTTNWIGGLKRDSLKKSPFIYFESNLYPKSYGVEVSHYNMYLFKKITPHILFALILLALTGAAFFNAYRSMKEQMRLSALRNDFISNISHELKTPVSTVKVAIEALQNFDMKNNPQVANEYLEMASLEIKRLELLITKVLNTSVMEEGRELFFEEIIDLKQLVDEVLQSLQLRFNQQNAVVKFETGLKQIFINADKLHVQGVLFNLLDNSLKYATATPEIIIRLEDSNNKAILTVSDNGPGIPKEYLDKVFDKFFRVPNDNRHNVKGYGLGLSYAAQVMQHHKGNIVVKNNSEHGCTFTLTFLKAEQ
ncbi:MAG: HAMP domain-containing sensor histidine kinase [Bacteroidia bacterium]